MGKGWNYSSSNKIIINNYLKGTKVALGKKNVKPTILA